MRRLTACPQARVHLADARVFSGGGYDIVSCFFLLHVLHELPDDVKEAVVDNLLGRMGSGGRAVFIDYHAPASWHPLRPVMRRIYDRFEPFAESLWRNGIAAFASEAERYHWETRTYFGGLYQKTVVFRREG